MKLRHLASVMESVEHGHPPFYGSRRHATLSGLKSVPFADQVADQRRRVGFGAQTARLCENFMGFQDAIFFLADRQPNVIHAFVASN